MLNFHFSFHFHLRSSEKLNQLTAAYLPRGGGGGAGGNDGDGDEYVDVIEEDRLRLSVLLHVEIEARDA